VYRKQRLLQISQSDSQTIVSHSETALLKETVAIMQSDIFILKRNEAICKQTLEKVSALSDRQTDDKNAKYKVLEARLSAVKNIAKKSHDAVTDILNELSKCLKST